jgi:hypothetical protein
MYFGPGDAPGATVHDLDRRERIQQVLSIDTDTAEVEVIDQPMRLCGRAIASRKIKFQAVWPIFGHIDPNRVNLPAAFHCHGRLN